jgi:hypothetical protein
LLPPWNRDIAIGLDGEEVAVDTKDDTGAAKLERVKEGRGNPQERSANRHCRIRISEEKRG